MHPEVHTYVVFGFAENLDWSTLHFIKPIGNIRVCSACRVVARKVAVLPCRHAMCEPCYEQWKPTAKVCPLDGDQCPEDEVFWRKFPVEMMMKCEVSCWNRDNGCETIMDASSIVDHFHRDCAYHSTYCPKCSSKVLRRDIIAHLETHCGSHVVNRMPKTHSERPSTELLDTHGGLNGIESALQSTCYNISFAPSKHEECSVKFDRYCNLLLRMALEMKQASKVMNKALSIVDRGRFVNQIADLKIFKAGLCAELADIERAADESECSATAARQKEAAREQCAEILEVLQKEMQRVTIKLVEWTSKVLLEAAIRESAAAHSLSEVLGCDVRSTWLQAKNACSSHGAIACVFENMNKVPAKLVWCVHDWSELRRRIQGGEPFKFETSVDVHLRYKAHFSINCSSVKGKFVIQAYAYGVGEVIFADPPKTVKLGSLRRQAGCLEHECHINGTGQERKRELTFRSGDIAVEDLEISGCIQHNMLILCLTIGY